MYVVNVPPVVSVVNVPSDEVVPAGVVTLTVKPVASCSKNIGTASQKSTVTVCPTPHGLGATLQKEMVGMMMLPAACACAVAVEATIKVTISIQSIVATILFFRNCIFFFFSFLSLFLLGNKLKSFCSIASPFDVLNI